MLTIYDSTGKTLQPHDMAVPVTTESIWYDLLNPTKEEDNFVEGILRIEVPTRAEMREIEASSRFYKENGAAYFTAYVAQPRNGGTAETSSVTFILTGSALVTVRYAEFKAFADFRQRVEHQDTPCTTDVALMVGLLETLIERMADLIEGMQDKVEKLAHGVFDLDGRENRERNLAALLRSTGTEGDVVARLQESATSLNRLLHVFRLTANERAADPKTLQRIETAEKDVHSLMENMRFLSERIGFLLNAILGLISTEQNQIIKLFSVMAVMLMPPTLVASVYGMNFHQMPELDWPFGYPMALGLMVVSAVIPYIYFRRKGWL